MAADISRWIGTLLTGEMEEPSKVWEILLEVDIFSKAREEDQGALALVLDLTKAFERVGQRTRKIL